MINEMRLRAGVTIDDVPRAVVRTEELRAAWRCRFPSLASLRSEGFILEGVDDLRQPAVLDWLRFLDRWQVESSERTSHDPYLRMHYVGSAHFTEEQVLWWRTLSERARPLLVCVAAALLPFALMAHDIPTISDPLARRVDAMLVSLRERLQAQPPTLRASLTEAALAEELARAIGALATAWESRLSIHLAQRVHELARAVAAFARLPRVDALTPVDRSGSRLNLLDSDASRQDAVRDLRRHIDETLSGLQSNPPASSRARLAPFDLLNFASACYDALSRLNGSAWAPPADIVAAPQLADLLAGNALYVRGDPDRGRRATLLLVPHRLLPSHGVPPSLAQRAYIAMLVAHELVPGHHLHFSAVRGKQREHIEVLQTPLGREGWAVFSEEAVLALPDVDRRFDELPLARAVLVHRLRRLVVALSRLEGADVRTSTLSRIRQALAASEVAMIRAAIQNESPAYGLGYVAFRRALETCDAAGVSRERLLSLGPIDPDIAADIVARPERLAH